MPKGMERPGTAIGKQKGNDINRMKSAKPRPWRMSSSSPMVRERPRASWRSSRKSSERRRGGTSAGALSSITVVTFISARGRLPSARCAACKQPSEREE